MGRVSTPLMAELLRARQSARAALNERDPANPSIPALVGHPTSGVVTVPSRIDFVYIQLYHDPTRVVMAKLPDGSGAPPAGTAVYVHKERPLRQSPYILEGYWSDGTAYYTINFAMDSAPGVRGILVSDTPGTIVEARLFSTVAATAAELSVWKAASGTIPVIGDSIGTLTMLAGHPQYVSATWNVAVNAGDVFLFYLTSCSQAAAILTVALKTLKAAG